ncbi:YeeE/YedE family protein [Bradyrhizobium sediminis]|uniref:YeeE/YedE family protein n=1 Tax=Bradyrhizobium sediminis TaxID=2840469 RepID=A0A975NEZ2_9BRAD|nr:YeeE/YedE family protein [Bradyrhizobium sediminis]QWG13316.1 YeeE/YedE family protein [Bradyrhizobium sediminis]
MPMIASLLCGLVFGAGLLISGMVQPTKVIGFLDIFGAWDPSLAVVMIAALAVSVPGFMLAKGRSWPLLAARNFWPTRDDIDRPLVVGSTLFGIGWGLVGLCPGPALESLATLSPDVLVFVAAMAAGMVLRDLWQRSRPATPREQALTSADG